jgi:hypothetical protein
MRATRREGRNEAGPYNAAMSQATLVLPPVLLAAAAVLSWGLGLADIQAGRAIVAAGAWLALLGLVATWFASGRAPVELTPPVTVASAPLVLRLDAAVVLFELVVLVPVALLLTFQERGWHESATAALAAAVALATLVTGSVVLNALGLATCAGLVLILMWHEEDGALRHYGIAMAAAMLLLVWAGVLLEVTGGTSAYGAVPVTALQVPVFLLVAGAGIFSAGLVPWRTWLSEVWTRRRLEAGALAVALLVPLGFTILARTYRLGAGQWPSPALNVALSALGAATALGAVVRAQAAASRRAFLGETVPFGGGLALLSLALGTPLGGVAAVTAVAGLGLGAGLAPLVPQGRGNGGLLGIAVATGAPPGLAFGAWLLSIQAGVEAGPAFAFIGLAGALAWLLGLAAAGRAIRLTEGAPPTRAEARGSALAIGLSLVAGAGLATFVALLAIPAVAELMPSTGGRSAQPLVSQAAVLGPGGLTLITPAGGWSATLVAVPLVLIGLAAAGLSGLLRRGRPAALAAVEPPPAPLFTPPLAGLPERAVTMVSRARLPEQYGSLLRPALLEAAAAGGRPFVWLLATAILAGWVVRG